VGRRAGLIGLGLLFAGFNTGNNLLYLLFAVLASCEVAGSFLAGWVLRRVDAEVIVPRRARAGAPMCATMKLNNRSKWFPLPSLLWSVRATGGEETSIRTPPVPPGGSGSGSGRLIPSARGWLAVAGAEVRTDYPLGLARRIGRLRCETAGRRSGGEKRRTALAEAPHVKGRPVRTLVTPKPLPGRPRVRALRRGDRPRFARPKGQGEEPVDAREYRPGDDARKMDWKASARTERLIWRARRGDPPRAIKVRFDRSGPAGTGFEARVSRAAGAVLDALRRGEAVGFSSDEVDYLPRSTPAQRQRILDYLAQVRPRAEVPRR
jgi:uncharacterized protein (DUF58 family)